MGKTWENVFFRHDAGILAAVWLTAGKSGPGLAGR
jgi:hypothetical protein